MTAPRPTLMLAHERWGPRAWQEFRGGSLAGDSKTVTSGRNSIARGGAWYQRWLELLAALVCFAIGVVLVFVPGPAVLFSPSARSSWRISQKRSRTLDWIEVRLRRGARAAWHWWKRASAVARGAVVGVTIVFVGAIGYLFYRVVILG
ncbi:MAG: hypothetical protein U1G07_00775 [Verrucomicrobiota bacterium]